jgi:hypothetical protein
VSHNRVVFPGTLLGEPISELRRESAVVRALASGPAAVTAPRRDGIDRLISECRAHRRVESGRL